MRHQPLILVGILAFGLLTGCGGAYESTAVKSWDLLSAGETDKALELYKGDVERKYDKLLRLMDEGIILRVARRYKESNEKFFEAAKIIEMNGYLSLGEQAVSLVTNEQQTTYQGEDFEKVLVHLYLGLNFLELKNAEAALVEMRRVNEILQTMINNANRPYELNAFARYLGGVLFENAGDLNDALVSYRNTWKILPALEKNFSPLGVDLLRMAKKMGMLEEFAEWKKTFGPEAEKAAIEAVEQRKGSLVVLLEAGKSPIKYSSKEQHKGRGKGGTLVEVLVPVAYYKGRPSTIRKMRLKIDALQQNSAVLNDVEETAIRHLKDRMGRQIAKAIATAATKVAIAAGVGKASNSSDVGVITGIALMLMSQADTRSWLLLPGSLQTVRIYLKPGKYSADIDYLNSAGGVVRSERVNNLEIAANRASFLQRRVFQ